MHQKSIQRNTELHSKVGTTLHDLFEPALKDLVLESGFPKRLVNCVGRLKNLESLASAFKGDEYIVPGGQNEYIVPGGQNEYIVPGGLNLELESAPEFKGLTLGFGIPRLNLEPKLASVFKVGP